MPTTEAKPVSIIRLAVFGAVIGVLYGLSTAYFGSSGVGWDVSTIVGGGIGGAIVGILVGLIRSWWVGRTR